MAQRLLLVTLLAGTWLEGARALKCNRGKYYDGTGDCVRCPKGRYNDVIHNPVEPCGGGGDPCLDVCKACPTGRYGDTIENKFASESEAAEKPGNICKACDI